MAIAQPTSRQSDPEEIVNKSMQKYSEKLELDDLQTALLKNHLLLQVKQRREIMQDPGKTREEKRQQIKKYTAKSEQELLEFLSEDQVALLKELQSKERAYRAKNRKRRWQ